MQQQRMQQQQQHMQQQQQLQAHEQQRQWQSAAQHSASMDSIMPQQGAALHSPLMSSNGPCAPRLAPLSHTAPLSHRANNLGTLIAGYPPTGAYPAINQVVAGG